MYSTFSSSHCIPEWIPDSFGALSKLLAWTMNQSSWVQHHHHKMVRLHTHLWLVSPATRATWNVMVNNCIVPVAWRWASSAVMLHRSTSQSWCAWAKYKHQHPGIFLQAAHLNNIENDPLVDSYYKNFHICHPFILPQKFLIWLYQDLHRQHDLKPLIIVLYFVGNLYHTWGWSISQKECLEKSTSEVSLTLCQIQLWPNADSYTPWSYSGITTRLSFNYRWLWQLSSLLICKCLSWICDGSGSQQSCDEGVLEMNMVDAVHCWRILHQYLGHDKPSNYKYWCNGRMA